MAENETEAIEAPEAEIPTFEEFQALQESQEPPAEEAEVAEGEESTQEGSESSGLDLNEVLFEWEGEPITRAKWHELQAGNMRHEDYTRKTQELSARKEKVANIEQIFDAWENNPDVRPLILQKMAEEAGIPLPGTTQAPNYAQTSVQPGLQGQYDPRDATPEWEQRGYASEGELLLDQKVSFLTNQLQAVTDKFSGYLSEQQKSVQADRMSHEAIAEIEREYHIKGVTPTMIRDAMLKTNIEDPVAAFLKVNYKSIVAKAAGVAGKAPALSKPNAPSPNGSKTFDPKEITDPDEMLGLLMDGFIPTTS